MLFSYNWLKDYIKGELPEAKKLAEKITMHFMEVEEIKKKNKDQVLDIDILPNRAPDCLSHTGIAREVAAILDKEFKPPKPKFREAQEKAEKEIEVEVKNRNDCPRYGARVIKGVEVKESPIWLKNRLQAVGVEPINNIVDAANYVMLATGQPIHIFDMDKLEGKKIIVRRAKNNEKIETLDGQKLKLNEEALTIADQKGPVAIAGIKGGQRTAIDKNTQNALIEAANFNRQLIRNTSKILKLKTDASWRFENGLSPQLVEYGANLTASFVSQISGGKIKKGMIDTFPYKKAPSKIKLNLDYTSNLLGKKIEKSTAKKILEKLGFKVTGQFPNLVVEVPDRRFDARIPEDLIEEIGRIIGFGNINQTYPASAVISPERNPGLLWKAQIKDTLKEKGFTETYNYSFISKQMGEIFGFSPGKLIEIKNPVSAYQQFLRPSLIINLVENAQKNFRFYDQLKLFEVGKTFQNKNNPNEKSKLSGIISRKTIEKEGFYELKGIIDSLMEKLGIAKAEYKSLKTDSKQSGISFWHSARRAQIKAGNKKIGFLGEISHKILEKMKIEQRIFGFEIDLETIFPIITEERQYQPLSPYPSAIRDVSVLVPRATQVVEILNVINSAGGKLVRDVDLFDEYTGENLPQNSKNLSFHITYRSDKKTLASEEVDQLHKNIIKSLESKRYWKVRK